MKKDLSPFWILLMCAISLIAAVALGEFLQWLDLNPDVKEEIGL